MDLNHKTLRHCKSRKHRNIIFFLNKILKNLTNTPWSIKNKEINDDIEMATIQEKVEKSCTNRVQKD